MIKKTTYSMNLLNSAYNYTEIAKVMSILLKDVPLLYTERDNVLMITFKGESFNQVEALAKVLNVPKIDVNDEG